MSREEPKASPFQIGEIDVSRETLEKLDAYESLLKRWQHVKNLVAPSTLSEIRTRHFADSAQLINICPNALHWLDIGSGAGFPGMIVAIFLAGRSNVRVDLVESDHRKCAFLRQVARETGAPVIVHCSRIENIIDSVDHVDVVTARAVAAMPMLLHLAKPLLKKGARGLFHKGQDVATELTNDPIFSSVSLRYIRSSVAENSFILDVAWLASDRSAKSTPD